MIFFLFHIEIIGKCGWITGGGGGGAKGMLPPSLKLLGGAVPPCPPPPCSYAYVTKVTKFSDQPLMLEKYSFIVLTMLGAQWVKRWPTDLADQIRSPFEA